MASILLGSIATPSLDITCLGKVFFRVAPLKGIVRFGKKGRLSLRYIGSFEILECDTPNLAWDWTKPEVLGHATRLHTPHT